MRWMWLSVAVVAPTLTGCSTVPRQEDVTRAATTDIVHQIRCEAKRAVIAADNYYKAKNAYNTGLFYKTATIAYDFDFDIVENNNTSAGVGWGLRYPLGGAFTVDASSGLNRTRATKRTFKIVDTFDQLRSTRCTPHVQYENVIYPIEGEIGIQEVLKTFIEMQQVDNPNSGTVFTFGDVLTFTTVLNGGVQPKLIIAPLTDSLRLAGASGDFSARRQDIHKVTLTLAGDPPKRENPVGKSLEKIDPLLLQTNSSLTAITILQARASPTDRALLELDRQQILGVQNRAQTVIVGQ